MKLIIFKKEQKKIEFFLKSIFKNVLLFDVNFLRNFFFNFKIFVLKIFFLEIDVLFNILDLFVYKTKYKTVWKNSVQTWIKYVKKSRDCEQS